MIVYYCERCETKFDQSESGVRHIPGTWDEVQCCPYCGNDELCLVDNDDEDYGPPIDERV